MPQRKRLIFRGGKMKEMPRPRAKGLPLDAEQPRQKGISFMSVGIVRKASLNESSVFG